MCEYPLLVIDTTLNLSLFLLKNDKCIGNLSQINTRIENIVIFIDDFLSSFQLRIADIKNFAINLGPGGFTSVRIGTSYLSGLIAFDKNIKYITFNRFDLIMQYFINSDEQINEKDIAIVISNEIHGNFFVQYKSKLNNQVAKYLEIGIDELNNMKDITILTNVECFNKLKYLNPLVCNENQDNLISNYIVTNKSKIANNIIRPIYSENII